MTSTAELLERIDASWHGLRPRLIAGQLDGRLADGRTVKEALAGVAFWNETVAPVFAWMRGQPELPAGQWYGGADLGIGGRTVAEGRGASCPRGGVGSLRL
jgi:hypothetical protein